MAPRFLYEMNGRKLPFACHAWERYGKAFWAEKHAFLRPEEAEDSLPGAVSFG